MNSDIRESLARLGKLRVNDLAGTGDELEVLLGALRKQVETQTGVVNTADASDPAYTAASNDLVGLLQLTQAAVNAKAEMTKLTLASGNAVSRVLKKAPK
jgi:hypothetical protein